MRQISNKVAGELSINYLAHVERAMGKLPLSQQANLVQTSSCNFNNKPLMYLLYLIDLFIYSVRPLT